MWVALWVAIKAVLKVALMVEAKDNLKVVQKAVLRVDS